MQTAKDVTVRSEITDNKYPKVFSTQPTQPGPARHYKSRKAYKAWKICNYRYKQKRLWL